ncbi:MAG: GNAT family N-acetyltransferase [Tissierellia bacterium]|nr:GNAT family N-acetyltransferase [Tissierellia bacterium]
MKETLNLYDDVQWTAYTDNPKQLESAINNSLKVWTVWKQDLLIGLARVVGDGYTIIYIQDILVLESYQGRGIGTELMKLIFDQYKSVRQIVLVTEDKEKNIMFYEKNGLTEISNYDCVAFMK